MGGLPTGDMGVIEVLMSDVLVTGMTGGWAATTVLVEVEGGLEVVDAPAGLPFEVSGVRGLLSEVATVPVSTFLVPLSVAFGPGLLVGVPVMSTGWALWKWASCQHILPSSAQRQ